MTISIADRWHERETTIAALLARKGRHKYLDDALALIQKPGQAMAQLEPKIGFNDADAHDAVEKRKAAIRDLPLFLTDLKKLSTVGLHGSAAHDAVLHFVLHGELHPHSFAAKEASLVYAIAALGGTEQWQKDAKARAEKLLADLQGTTLERFEAGKGKSQAHADYKAAAAEWDNLYEAVKGLVSAAAHLMKDAKLYDEVIWTHPRHLTVVHGEPAPHPLAVAQ